MGSLKVKDIEFVPEKEKVVVESLENVENVQYTVAIYKQGKLKDIELRTVDITYGENKLDKLIDEYGDADTVKVMLWNGEESLAPIAGLCETEL